MIEVDIYLDIDGVIVPWFDPVEGIDVRASGFRDWRGQSLTHDRAEPVRGLRTYSPRMIRRIRAIGEMPHVRIHWCTTWRTGAHALAAAVGLPTDWPVLDEDMVHDRRETEERTLRSWWKRDAVQEHHADGREGHAVVWIDDDLAFDADALDWMSTLGREGLAVHPRTVVGLPDLSLDVVEDFCLTRR